MMKMKKYFSCLTAAALMLALLCVSGCTSGESIKVGEDNSFTYSDKYEDYYDGEFLNKAMELAKMLGESWYGEGNSADENSEISELLGYAVSAHTQDGRGVIALHNPGSVGMSQIDFILLTTKDYGRTWNPGGGVYHIVGNVTQTAIKDDNIYVIVSSGTFGSSDILISEDFGDSFRMFTAEDIVPAKYRSRMSELYNVYMRIVNVENDGEIVLEFYCDGYMEVEENDSFNEYKTDFISDEEMVIMILSSDAQLSNVNTLYADESFF